MVKSPEHTMANANLRNDPTVQQVIFVSCCIAGRDAHLMYLPQGPFPPSEERSTKRNNLFLPSPPLCPSLPLCVSVSLCLCFCPSLSLCVSLSLFLSLSVSVSVSLCLSVCLCLSVSLCLCVCLSVCLSL